MILFQSVGVGELVSGEMILTGEDRSIGRESCPSATPYTINPSRTDLASESCRLVLPADDKSPESWTLCECASHSAVGA